MMPVGWHVVAVVVGGLAGAVVGHALRASGVGDAPRLTLAAAAAGLLVGHWAKALWQKRKGRT